MTPQQVEALSRATLGHALIQVAVHFPAELDELELTVPAALARALALAEEAISLAPELPDGHTLLGRLLLCHDDPQAGADAVEVLKHALSLDPEHDPAEVALAAALREQGDTDAALEHVERVLRRGNGMPQPAVLRALLLLDAGHVEEARRDLERAVRIAPGAGLFRLDAARAAEAGGDHDAAELHRQESRTLLGAAYDVARRLLDGK